MIIEAAAELIVEDGVGGLTHRKIAARAGVPLGSTTHYFESLTDLRDAALEFLAAMMDSGLAELGRELAGDQSVARVLARVFHQYLSDPVRVRADAAFYVVATQDPGLRPLATRWFDGLVDILSGITDQQTAVAVAVYGDGAMLHAMLHDTALSEEELEMTIERLMENTNA